MNEEVKSFVFYLRYDIYCRRFHVIYLTLSPTTLYEVNQAATTR